MTIATQPTAPISARILAAYSADAAIRRVQALTFLAQVARMDLPVSTGTARLWGAIGDLLVQCAFDLHGTDRADYFHGLAKTALDLEAAMRADLLARKTARKPTRARVIDATCAEVSL